MLAALAHGLDVIEFLASQKRPVPLGAVAAAIGMSKAGTHRILSTLVARGFVVRGEGSDYGLGYKAWEIGWSVPGVQVVPRAVPVMQRLAAEIGDGAILGALDSGFEVVYLHVIESQQPVRVYIDVGSRLPANVTATGLALLAWQPRDRLEVILPKKLPQWAPETITDPDELRRELDRIRVRGYAQTLGTFNADIGGVAAPVFGADGSVLAALCVSSPRYRIDAAWNKRVPRAVMAAAKEMSGVALPGSAATPMRNVRSAPPRSVETPARSGAAPRATRSRAKASA